MWNCSNCNTSVKDQFENCPSCGTGRDGSAASVDFVKKKDAVQPGMPAAGPMKDEIRNKMFSIIIVLVVIAILLVIAFKK
ncbi:MAG: hypothetical protein JXR25_14035 [Pontiellaceae bacterium]|nr:hypothetical protein [Pontiellaceae bacterium]MBN2785938.1 hypothetical protein [Pontiellaceae bacterium]